MCYYHRSLIVGKKSSYMLSSQRSRISIFQTITEWIEITSCQVWWRRLTIRIWIIRSSRNLCLWYGWLGCCSCCCCCCCWCWLGGSMAHCIVNLFFLSTDITEFRSQLFNLLLMRNFEKESFDHLSFQFLFFEFNFWIKLISQFNSFSIQFFFNFCWIYYLITYSS